MAALEEAEEYYVYKSANFSIKFLGTFKTLEEATEVYDAVPLIRAAGIYFKNKEGAIKNIKFFGVPNYNSKFFEEASKEAIKARKFSSPPISILPQNNSNESISREVIPKPMNPFQAVSKEIQDEFYSDKRKIDKSCNFHLI